MANQDRLRRLTTWLAIAAAIGMFIVLVMGATVTNTGSEHGCGKSWPLCNGKLIPQAAVSTMIEFSHRAVVGVESVLIIAVAVAAMLLFPRRDVRILAPVMVGFLFLQAGLGAWAVMYPQAALILALHFGVSLVAFASVLLVAVILTESGGADEVRDRPLAANTRRFIFAVTAYSYVVVYLGAYVRHIDADEACTGWPLCNGAVIPVFHDKVGAAFTHRVAALGLLVALGALVWWARRLRAARPDLFRASLVALGLALAQSVSGAFVVFTGLDLFAALAHAALVGLMFGCLAYMCLHLFPRPVATRAAATSPAGLSYGVLRETARET